MIAMVSWRGSRKAEIDKSLSDIKNGWPGVIAYVKKTSADAMRRTHMPGGTVSDLLTNAIDIGMVYPEHEYVTFLLETALRHAREGLADEEKWQTRWKGLRDDHLAELLASMALTQAILANADIDADVMARSRLHFIASAKQFAPLWGTVVESAYLKAVQNCLVIGHLSQARDLLDTAQPFVDAHRWYVWLDRLMRDIAALKPGHCLSATSSEFFQDFFDLVRDPAFTAKRFADCYISEKSIVLLQMALIKRRYVLGLPLPGGWHDVLLSISE
jgi:hypothetical protein